MSRSWPGDFRGVICSSDVSSSVKLGNRLAKSEFKDQVSPGSKFLSGLETSTALYWIMIHSPESPFLAIWEARTRFSGLSAFGQKKN